MELDWYKVIAKLQEESTRCFTEAQALAQHTDNPGWDMMNLSHATIKATAGDLLRSLALALIQGLKP